MADRKTEIERRIRELQEELRGLQGAGSGADVNARGTNGEGLRTRDGRNLRSLRGAMHTRNRRLVDLQRQKDELLSIVAHDLRTPLVAIQGFAQLLQVSGKMGQLGEKQREYVERVLQAVRAMNQLVDDLLTARRLEKERLPLRPRPVDVASFVDANVELQRETARQKEIEIEIELPEHGCRARFDPDRMGQVLGNLVQNAVQHTPSGGRVGVRFTKEGKLLRCEVTDQGQGIEPELLPHLFRRFTRGASSEITGTGYGLGLFICRELVQLHGGEIGAENLSQGGSRFWFELPADPPANSERAPP